MTKNLKLYQLKNISKCKYKAYISQFNFKTLNNKSNMIRKVYKEILQDTDLLLFTEENLKQLITNKLDTTYFLTKQEKEVEITTAFEYILRYINYEKGKYSENRKVIARKLYGTVNINDIELEVNADIVFENEKSIEIVKFKTGATKLSYKARTDKNLPENDIELFLLKRLGEKLYSSYNKPIISSFYHLKGKAEDTDILKQLLKDKSIIICNVAELESLHFDDKKLQKTNEKRIKEMKDVLYFNNSEGNNIITYNYDKDLSDVITELANTELSSSSKKCKSSDCEFCDYSTLCNSNKKVQTDLLETIKEVAKSSGDVKLTEAQKQVVDVEEGNYRVNAVAGSGKSTCMVMRVIELFKKGYNPSDILMITFTNKGAQELREKIIYWLKHYNIKDVNTKALNIFTFNSFGDHIISKEWERLGFTEKPSLASSIDVLDTVKELLEEYPNITWLNYKSPLINFPHAKGAFIQLMIYFNLIKSFNHNIDSLIIDLFEKEKLELEDASDKAKLIFELYDKFNAKLKSKNLLQYADQILYTTELLGKYPELINQYGYKHIIVDEYQDTDSAQIKALHLLRNYKECKSLMVVGDSSQAIFGFRNTTSENIIKFHEEFDNVKDIFLLDNFRSTPEICNVANKLDKLNTERIDKEIVGKKASGMLPQLLQYKTLDDEYKGISDLIDNKINGATNAVPKHEICVIARTKKELLEIQECLNVKNIPSVVEVSELYIDNTNVQLIINLANFFKNNDYDYYLMEYLSMADIIDFSKWNTRTIKESIDDFKVDIIEEFGVIEDEQLKIKYFNDFISEIIESDIIAQSFMEIVKAKEFSTFNEFLNYLHKFMLYQDNTAIDKDTNKYDCICLTTGHSSKGKEWDIVINTINKYKYDDIISDIPALEEERRLLFVSITRAKNELYVSYNTNEDKSRGKGKYCGFANELVGTKGMEKVEC